MNQEFFSEWKNKVDEINQIAEEVVNGREEAYSLLSEELKKIFEENGTVAESIHFNSNGSVITVTFESQNDSILFKNSFIESIGMPFSVKRRLTDRAEHELYLELYPMGE